jgi:hypothetical protein
MLNEAIWNKPDNGAHNTSSSSSEDEDDHPTTKKRGAKTQAHHRRPHRHPHHRKDSRGSYSRFNVGNDDYNTSGKVSKRDGRLNISVNETNNRGYLAKALGANFIQNIALDPSSARVNDPEIASIASEERGIPRPRLNIVVMVIGSRGDIQPFLKLGKNLKEYGHRVRIATHPAFKDFFEKY